AMLAAGRDFAFTAVGNIENHDTVAAGRNLSLSATDLTNTGAIAANNAATLSARRIVNAGDIDSTHTRVHASERLDNTGTGVIDGVTVRLDTPGLHNTGRLYGDHLAIQA